MATSVGTPNLTFVENEELTFQIPVINKVSSFTSIAETSTGTFSSKLFRYTTDGVNWSDWDTTSNMTSVAVVAKQVYLFELKYKAATVATLTDFTLTFSQHTTLYPINAILTVPTIFGQIEEDDHNYVFWYNNVKDKFEKEGILPMFIERTEDYLDYWEANCKLFALLYAFTVNSFSNMYDNEETLSLYLRQRGMYLSGDEDITELQGLANTFYKEISKRGTKAVVTEGYRIANTQIGDEMLYAFVQRWYAGWNSQFTSPISTYAGGIQGLNKLPEKERLGVPQLLTNYMFDTQWGGTITIDNSVDDFDFHQNSATSALLLNLTNVGASEEIGINATIATTEWDSLKIPVDERVAYEIYFRVKVSGTASSATLPEIIFGVYGVNEAGAKVSFEEIITLSASDNFLEYAGDLFDSVPLFSTSQYNSDEFMEVRGIIYPKGTAGNADPLSNSSFFNLGSHLRFPTAEKIVYMYPKIVFTQQGADFSDYQVFIKNVRVQPLYLSHGQGGFMTNTPQIIPYLYNGSVEYTDDELKREVDKFLLPANTINLYEFVS